MPSNREDLKELLKVFLLDRSIHELSDTLEVKPGSAEVPIRVLSTLMDETIKNDKQGPAS